MAKLKTRTNQPVTDSEGLLEHIAQEGNKTIIGGHLEVDGDLKVNGNVEVDMTPIDIEDLLNMITLPDDEQKTLIGDLHYVRYITNYTPEQVLNILSKYSNRLIVWGEMVIRISMINMENIGSAETISGFEYTQSYLKLEGYTNDIAGNEFPLYASTLSFYSTNGVDNFICFEEL